MYFDKYTGKPFDSIIDRLPAQLKSKCEECDTHLINHCASCGAPICCPKCCAEETVALHIAPSDTTS